MKALDAVALNVVDERTGAAAPAPVIFAYIVICSYGIADDGFSDWFMAVLLAPYGSVMTQLKPGALQLKL
jgi:hypothetical protein